jgi:hypothetical protein
MVIRRIPPWAYQAMNTLSVTLARHRETGRGSFRADKWHNGGDFNACRGQSVKET